MKAELAIFLFMILFLNLFLQLLFEITTNILSIRGERP